MVSERVGRWGHLAGARGAGGRAWGALIFSSALIQPPSHLSAEELQHFSRFGLLCRGPGDCLTLSPLCPGLLPGLCPSVAFWSSTSHPPNSGSLSSTNRQGWGGSTSGASTTSQCSLSGGAMAFFPSCPCPH